MVKPFLDEEDYEINSDSSICSDFEDNQESKAHYQEIKESKLRRAQPLIVDDPKYSAKVSRRSDLYEEDLDKSDGDDDNVDAEISYASSNDDNDDVPDSVKQHSTRKITDELKELEEQERYPD
jgi:hypothetical protein